MRLLPAALAASLLFSGASAFADTVYTLENVTGTGNYGSVTLNTTAGSVTSINSTDVINGTSVTFTGAPISQSYNTLLDGYTATFSAGGDQLQLFLTSFAAGYTPANNTGCSTLFTFFCDYTINEFQGVPSLANPSVGSFSGNLVATATPEPSSLLLLGTGLLGVVGAARRRFAQSR